MIERALTPFVEQALREVPAVCLLGPRQVGKTTLALRIARARDAIYLDLESDRDLAKLSEPELYLAQHSESLVVIDEVHRAPGLFPVLRGLIDRSRRGGSGLGHYLLLGSASLDLLRQSGESLAGRVRYLELAPFSVGEWKGREPERLWLRGGFPGSLLAPTDAQSLRWRQDFIRTYLERDVSQFGARIPAETLRRFWTMLAHNQGAILNTASLARGLGINVKTANRYLDLLVDLLLVRRLPPWHANVGKRLVKSPKVYLRDSGLAHALIGIGDTETLAAHPARGASWEGFVIENLLNSAAADATGFFYRTSAGAEVDLLLVFPGDELWAIEVKRSLIPRPERGFHHACDDIEPARRFVVYPGQERIPLGNGIEAVPADILAAEIFARRRR